MKFEWRHMLAVSFRKKRQIITLVPADHLTSASSGCCLYVYFEPFFQPFLCLWNIKFGQPLRHFFSQTSEIIFGPVYSLKRNRLTSHIPPKNKLSTRVSQNACWFSWPHSDPAHLNSNLVTSLSRVVAVLCNRTFPVRRVQSVSISPLKFDDEYLTTCSFRDF